MYGRGHTTGHKQERRPSNAWYQSAEAETIIQERERQDEQLANSPTAYYRIKCQDGTILPGVWTEKQARDRALWEKESVTFLELTADELKVEQASTLRWALGM